MKFPFNQFPFNNRQFLFLWLAQLTSQIGINMLNVVLAILVYERTQSNAAVGILVLMFNLPGLLFGATSGAIVDRLDKKAVLVLVNFIRMLLIFGFIFTTESQFATYGLALILSVLTQFFYPAEGATIPRVVGDHPQNLFRANSLFTITFYIATIIGYITGGPMLLAFGPKVVFIVISGFLFMAYIFVAALSFSRFSLRKFLAESPVNGNLIKINRTMAIINQVREDVNIGLQLLRENPRLRMALISLGLAQMLISVFLALSPGFAREVLQIPVTDASLKLFGPAVAGMVITALILNRFGAYFVKHRQKLILYGMTFAGLTLVALSFTQRFPLDPIHRFQALYLPVQFNNFLGIDLLLIAQILMFLIGLFEVLVDIPCNTILQEEAGEERRGRVYGLLTTFVTGGSVLPVLFGGFLADRVGVTKVMLVMGIIVVVFGIFIKVKNTQSKTTS